MSKLKATKWQALAQAAYCGGGFVGHGAVQ
jgi:hypothetical protein